ncbi:MAG: hypothetical protein LBK53_09555 [Heliobacteriaceae bacterium]|jgi:hypothetical protein|nr:hypothetical protein [Heliobacteriaceae bacterium]
MPIAPVTSVTPKVNSRISFEGGDKKESCHHRVASQYVTVPAALLASLLTIAYAQPVKAQTSVPAAQEYKQPEAPDKALLKCITLEDYEDDFFENPEKYKQVGFMDTKIEKDSALLGKFSLRRFSNLNDSTRNFNKVYLTYDMNTDDFKDSGKGIIKKLIMKNDTPVAVVVLTPRAVKILESEEIAFNVNFLSKLDEYKNAFKIVKL